MQIYIFFTTFKYKFSANNRLNNNKIENRHKRTNGIYV